MVSSGELNAVIYVLDGGDVLQSCGRNGLFQVEIVNMIGKTPNNRLLQAPERASVPGTYRYEFCGEEITGPRSEMLTRWSVLEIVRWMLQADLSGGWCDYLPRLCDELGLTIRYAVTMGRRFVTIRPRNEDE